MIWKLTGHKNLVLLSYLLNYINYFITNFHQLWNVFLKIAWWGLKRDNTIDNDGSWIETRGVDKCTLEPHW